jgi:hypothetical protein
MASRRKGGGKGTTGTNEAAPRKPREVALAAADDAEARDQDAKARRREQLEEEGRTVLERSPLSEWWPDAQWSVVDVPGAASVIVTPEPDRDFMLLLRGTRSTEVRMMREDPEQEGRFISGPLVRNVAEVGAYLREQDG